jgi:hypothetical protein
VRLVEHHAAVLAIPAVLPALVVVGVIVMIAIRDRRQEHDEQDEDGDPK